MAHPLSSTNRLARWLAVTVLSSPGLAMLAAPSPIQAQTRVISACSGVSLPPSVVTGIMSPVITGIATPTQSTVNAILGVPLLSSVAPGLNLNATGLLASAAAGAPITLQALATDNTVIGPSDQCRVTSDAITLDTAAGVAIGGNQITGLGVNGAAAFAGDLNAIAFGNNARAESGALGSIAFGTNSSVTAANSVALGSGASAGRGALTGYAATGLAGPQNSAGEVSIGAPGALRQLTNVAAGSAATDVATVGQVNGVAAQVTAQVTALGAIGLQYDTPARGRATLAGAGGTVLANVAPGALTALSTEAVNGAQLFATNQAIGVNTGAIVGLDARVTSNAGGLAALDAVAIRYDAADHARATLGGAGGTVLDNLAPGTVAAGSLQAVNGAQLFASNAQIAAATGAIAGLGTGRLGPIRYSSAAAPTVPNGTTVTDDLALTGVSGGIVGLHNLREATLAIGSTDAVTGAQLFATDQAVTANAGAIAGLGVRLGTAEAQVVGLQNTAAATGATVATLSGQVTANGNAITGLSTRVGSTETQVAGLQSTVTANGATLANLSGQVTTNTGAIAGLGTRLGAAETQVGGLQTAVAANGTALTNLSGAVSGLGTRIGGAETQIAGLQTAVTANGTTVANLSGQVAANTGAIAGLGTRLGTTEAQVAGLQGVVTANGTTVGNLSGQVSANTSAINGLDTRVGGTETQVAGLQTTLAATGATVATLSGQVSTNTGAIAGLDTRVGGAETQISGLQTAVAANGAAMANLSGTVAVLDTRMGHTETQVAGLQTAVTSNGAAIANLSGQVTANTGAINGLDARVGTNETQIAGLQTAVSSNGAAMTNLSGQVTANTAAIGGLDTRVAGAETQITGLRSAVSTNGAAMTALSGQVTANTRAIGGLDTRVGTTEAQVAATTGSIAALDGRVGTAEANVTDLQSTAAANIAMLASLSGRVTTNTDAIGTLQTAVANQPIRYADPAAPATPGGSTPTDEAVLVGAGGGTVRLGNLRAGTVAAGSTDAVNGGQLAATDDQVADLGDELAATNTRQAVQRQALANLTGLVTGSTVSPLQYSGRDTPTEPNGGTLTNDVTLTGADLVGPVALHNVAAGAVTAGSTDAVNGGQLYAVAAVANNGVQYERDAAGNRTDRVRLLGTTADAAVTLANVAPGQVAAGSTDAVNGGQLYATDQTARQAAALGANSVQYDAGGTSVSLGAGGSAPVALRNVAAGTAPTDAVNVAELQGSMRNMAAETRSYVDTRMSAGMAVLDFDLKQLRRDAGAGTAAALAAAALPQANEPGHTMIAIGGGTYRGQSSVSLGASTFLNDGHSILRIGATYDSRGYGGANAGFGYQF